MGDRVFIESFESPLCRGVSTAPGATALKRMLLFAYSFARLRITASNPPLVIVGMEAGTPAMGMAVSAAVMHVTLSDEDEPLEVCGDKGAKLVDGVIREWFAREDAGTADNVVDRAKLFDCGLRDFVRCCCKPDVSFDQRKVR